MTFRHRNHSIVVRAVTIEAETMAFLEQTSQLFASRTESQFVKHLYDSLSVKRLFADCILMDISYWQ